MPRKYKDRGVFGTEELETSIGHICTGGGASIKNSPVNFAINIYVNDTGTVPFIAKLKSTIGGFIGTSKTRTIAVTPRISETELQGVIVRQIENG